MDCGSRGFYNRLRWRLCWVDPIDVGDSTNRLFNEEVNYKKESVR